MCERAWTRITNTSQGIRMGHAQQGAVRRTVHTHLPSATVICSCSLIVTSICPISRGMGQNGKRSFLG